MMYASAPQLDLELLADGHPCRTPPDLEITAFDLFHVHTRQEQVVPLPVFVLKPDSVRSSPEEVSREIDGDLLHHGMTILFPERLPVIGYQVLVEVDAILQGSVLPVLVDLFRTLPRSIGHGSIAMEDGPEYALPIRITGPPLRLGDREIGAPSRSDPHPIGAVPAMHRSSYGRSVHEGSPVFIHFHHSCDILRGIEVRIEVVKHHGEFHASISGTDRAAYHFPARDLSNGEADRGAPGTNFHDRVPAAFHFQQHTAEAIPSRIRMPVPYGFLERYLPLPARRPWSPDIQERATYDLPADRDGTTVPAVVDVMKGLLCVHHVVAPMNPHEMSLRCSHAISSDVSFRS